MENSLSQIAEQEVNSWLEEHALPHKFLSEKLVDLPKRIGRNGDMSALDIGCGVDHDNDYDFFEERYATPMMAKWASRATEGGWNVVGVDRSVMRSKPFSWIFIQRDITKDDSLENLPLAPFDLVNIQHLVSLTSQHIISPSLCIGDFDGRPHLPSYSPRLDGSVLSRRPLAEFSTFDQYYVQFLKDFLVRVKDVMKEGGLALVNEESLFVKEKGQLKVLRDFTNASLLGVMGFK